MTTRIDLDELERKANAATMDEWQWRPGDPDVIECKHDGLVVLFAADEIAASEPAIIASTGNRAHIAAVSPPVVLALIARIRYLEGLANNAAVLLEALSDLAARREWAKAIRERVEKGAVLP